MTEILLFFLLPLLLLLFLLLPILPKIAKYMSRTQVPEEDQRVSTVSDLKSYEPRPKAIIRTEGKSGSADGLGNMYWWDPSGEASDANGTTIIESNVSGYGNGEANEGVWRRMFLPFDKATTDDLSEGSSNLYHTTNRVRNELETEGGLNYAKNIATIAGTEYSGKSFDVSSEDSSPVGFSFNGGGTKLFMSGASNTNIYEYNLSTGFDVSTASYSSTSFNVGNEASQLQDVAFNGDGTKMFICDANGDVYEYNLNTGFDISTANYSNTSFEVGGLAGEEDSPRGFGFSGDGTKMFVLGTDSKKVHEYDLSTGFDLSTANYSSKNFDVTGEEQFPEGLEFNTDGTEMFVFGAASDSIIQYNLSSSFDVSSVSYSDKNFDPTSQTEPSGVAFNGDKMFISGSGSVFQYDTNASKGTLSIGVSGNVGAVQRSDGSGGFAGSTSDLYVDPSTGDVGIGTDSPSRNVHIKDDAENSDGLLISINDSEPITVRNTGFNSNIKTFFVRQNSDDIEMGSNYDLDLYAGGDKMMFFSSAPNGGVGIGTDSASTSVSGKALTLAQEDNDNNTALTIKTSDDTASAFIDFDDSQGQGSGGRVKYDHSDDSLRFGTNGVTEQMRVAASGKVGVGTTNPSTKLEVNGDITTDNIIQKGGQLPQVYRETRSIPGTVDDYVEIGNFSTNYGGHSIKVNITVSAYTFSTAKQYLIPIKTGQTSGNWRKVLPISENVYTASGTDQNFSLQIKSDGDYAYLRIRRSSGTNSRDATITIQQLGLTGDSFTSQNGTGSTSEKPVFSGTVITQKYSRVGIGTNSPDRRLHVEAASSRDVAAIIESSNDSQTWLSFVDPNSTSDTHTLIGNDGDDLLFRSGNNETMRIDAAGQVGIGKSSPNKALDVAGQVTMDDSYIRNLSNISSDTTTNGDDFYSVDTSGGSVQLTLSSSDAETGRVIHIKRNGTQRVDIVTESSETIDGRSSAQLGSDEESVRLVYNGANSDWEVY